jgi:hypothetical protein
MVSSAWPDSRTYTPFCMIVIPALYLKFGRAEALVRAEDYPREMELATRKGSSPTL